MAQILSFPYTIWLVFFRIFANKRISVLLITVLKVKHSWKRIRTLELEPRVNHPKLSQNFAAETGF